MRGDPIERLLRAAYSAALYLLAPVTVYHLIWRGFRHPEYLHRWSERYAVYDGPPRGGTVWLHAVSVGEVAAAAPVVDALRRERPDLRLLVTTITPTGSARVRALWGDGVDHVYLPYDLPGAVSRFLRHFRPSVALIMETELWPNLLFGCRDHGVPVFVLNARLSARSLRGYQVLAPLVSRALRTVAHVAAQSHADAVRFVRLGAPRNRVSEAGNLKYDVGPASGAGDVGPEFRQCAGGRPCWVAASTHEGEEDAVVALHARLRARHPGLLLVWAPRHPERFRAAAQRAVAEGWRTATRRLTHWPDTSDEVFVLDTLGELAAFYACGDVAFVGGSLQPVGGHNLLEPAATGTPVVTGPHLHNFADIARHMREAGALRVGDDVAGVGDALEALLADRAARDAMADAGRRMVAQGRGALARTLELVLPELPPAPG
ncbi:lipid IV(A) 3-deoxy-D-manno-octulosonic acid transferase [Luteimonas pelagia]